MSDNTIAQMEDFFKLAGIQFSEEEGTNMILFINLVTSDSFDLEERGASTDVASALDMMTGVELSDRFRTQIRDNPELRESFFFLQQQGRAILNTMSQI